MNLNKDLKYLLRNADETEKSAIWQLLEAVSSRLSMSNNQNILLLNDYKRIIIYYLLNGYSVADILKLVSVDKLGDFYKNESPEWYPLDNAAKVFPLSMTGSWMAVFRVSAYLKERVQPELLQMALNFTIKRFPYFATTVKKGVFWHYLDANMRRYEISPELNKPCSYIQVSHHNSQSFKVLYYKNRISVEFFHILTDGTGGLVFVKSLVAEYLRLLGKNIPSTFGIMDIAEAPNTAEWSNDFAKAQKGESGGSLLDLPALQIAGDSVKHPPHRILQFNMDSDKVYAFAKSKGVSVTVLMLAYMFLASKAAITTTHGNLKVQVPINMRGRYDSITMRNFVLFALIKLPYAEVTTLDELLVKIKEQLDEQASDEQLYIKMNVANKTVTTLKYVPLIVKRPVMLSSGGYSTKMFTNTLSNLGVVRTPEEMNECIDKFDFFIGNPANKRVGCTMITYNNKLVFSIAKSTKNDVFEETLYKLLIADGFEIIVEGSKDNGR